MRLRKLVRVRQTPDLKWESDFFGFTSYGGDWLVTHGNPFDSRDEAIVQAKAQRERSYARPGKWEKIEVEWDC